MSESDVASVEGTGNADRLHAHLAEGAATVARCWAVTGSDGVVRGFTEHDCALRFEGITFRAASGLSASALSQGTGLAVDNLEAVGALSHDSLTEADIAAGRYDGAEVRAWLVNWADPSARVLQFRGSLGEIERTGGAFHAELRGLTEALNRPRGRVYHLRCAAILGDSACRFDLTREGFSAEVVLAEVPAPDEALRLTGLEAFDPGWFTGGQLSVLDGAAASLAGQIREDRVAGADRLLSLWTGLPVGLVAGDRIRVQAGCDRSVSDCRFKFTNLLNFRGFPHLPPDDWLLTHPRAEGVNDGGSLMPEQGG